MHPTLGGRGDGVGLSVGTAVGAAVGPSEGKLVGDTVGVSVGDVVGDKVGASVGAAVGSRLGEFVGKAVGLGVGGAVENSFHATAADEDDATPTATMASGDGSCHCTRMPAPRTLPVPSCTKPPCQLTQNSRASSPLRTLGVEDTAWLVPAFCRRMMLCVLAEVPMAISYMGLFVTKLGDKATKASVLERTLRVR